MIRTYKARAKLSPFGHRRLDDILAMQCTLYNAALEERVGAWKAERKSVTLYDQIKSLKYIRSDDANYESVPVSVMRSPLHRIDKAFKRFFDGIKRGNGHGFPRFKSIKRYRSFDIFDSKVCKTVLKSNRLEIKGINIPLKLYRELPDKENLKFIRVIRKPSRVEVHLGYELPDVDMRESHNPVGIDMGVISMATLSTGEKFARRRRKVQKIKRLQRMIARRRRGSNRRKKAVTMLRKEWQRVVDPERNYMHRVTADMVKRFDGFAVEDLDIKNMIKRSAGNNRINHAIIEQRWGTFIRLLEEKAESAGLPMVKVDPKNTSKMCSACGKIIEKSLKTRVHRCICGLEMDRDENAALNILARGFPSTRVGNVEIRPAQTLTDAVGRGRLVTA